jgi:gluconate:H+ symporter, GntP family
MNHNTTLLLITALSIALLVISIVRWKLHSFIALVLVSLIVGLCSGMKLSEVGKSFQEGVGTVLGSIAMVIGLGTVLGKMLAESGGAAQITRTIVQAVGPNRAHWALAGISFVIGLPVFFAVGYVLMVPIVFVLARELRAPLLFLGMPLVTGLALAHNLVPPHPGIMAAIGLLKGDVGKIILYSLLIGLPVSLLLGPLLGKLAAVRVPIAPTGELAEQFARSGEHRNPPSCGLALFTILLPVLLMLLSTIVELSVDTSTPMRQWIRQWTSFLGHPVTALTASVLFSFYSFGTARGLNGPQILKFSEECLGPIAGILLIVGAGGGFSRVLVASGVGGAISDLTSGLDISLMLLGWLMAAAIRVAVGSATVAITTASGLIAPLVATQPGTNLELLILALGAGSLMLSHVNDGGFWIVKEYFNLTVAETLKTWTVMTVVASILVLGLVFLLNALT